MSLNLPYNSKVIAVTASTNTAAAQVGGHTIHSAAQLRRRKLDLKNPNVIITPETRLAFIDEISMLPFGDFGKTDKHLRRIRSTNNDQLIRVVFGGMHMVTSGDFFPA
jgi:PIF1 helicase.